MGGARESSGNNPPLLNLNKGEYQVPVAYLSSVNGLIALVALTFGVLLVVTLPKLRVTRGKRSPAADARRITCTSSMVFSRQHRQPALLRTGRAFMALFIVRRAPRGRTASGWSRCPWRPYAVIKRSRRFLFIQRTSPQIGLFKPLRLLAGSTGAILATSTILRLGTQVRMKGGAGSF